MKNALFQARQFAFWMGVVVLFRILLHIPDAEGMLPVNQLELFSSGMDIFMYGLMLIYATFLLSNTKHQPRIVRSSLIFVLIAASVLIWLHLLTWHFANCDPDVYWKEGPWWFKLIYLASYFQLSILFFIIFLRIPHGVHVRWWALANSLIGLPFILCLFFLGTMIPLLDESFSFMLFKDLGMDITLLGFYWSLSNSAKQLSQIGIVIEED